VAVVETKKKKNKKKYVTEKSSRFGKTRVSKKVLTPQYKKL